MTILDEIRTRLPVPKDFGVEQPYARFSWVQDDRRSGEDITLEFQAAEAPGDVDLVVFSYSQWREEQTDRRPVSRPLCTVTLDFADGEPRAESAAHRAELVVKVREALTHAGQLELVGR